MSTAWKRRSRGAAALVALCLVAGGPAVAQPTETLVLDPTSGPPGAVVSASGTFTVGHCGVRLLWAALDGPVLEEPPVGRDGGYATSITIPIDVAPGSYAVFARGLLMDPDGGCTAQSDLLVDAPFEVVPAEPPPTPKLTLPNTTPQPGQGILLDGSQSIGNIIAFNFDVDGNGSFETKCGGSKAAAVQTEPGTVEVGLEVVASDGQKAVDTVAINVGGIPVPPPSGGAQALQEGTVVATCMDDVPDLAEAILKAYMCPDSVMLGVIEAIFHPALKGSSCFQRTELEWGGSLRPAFAPVGYKPIFVNGLVFQNGLLAEWGRIAIIEKPAILTTNPPGGTARLGLGSFGGATGFQSERIPLGWDVSEPGVVGAATLGVGPQATFLGLKVAKKATFITFTAQRRARLTLHLSLPFIGQITETSPLVVTTDNNEGPQLAAFSLSFPDLHLGVFILEDVTLAYAKEGSDHVWQGGLTLVFPVSGGLVKAGGTLRIVNGVFQSATAHLDWPPPGIGPIGCCVWLYSIGASVGSIFLSAAATFGAGPTVYGDVRAAEVTGSATIWYSPFQLLLKASGVKAFGVPISATATVLITGSMFWAQGHLDEDWGPLEIDAVVEAKFGGGGWFTGGGGVVCADLEVTEICGGGYGGAGPSGVSGCASFKSKIKDIHGGVRLGWSFFTGNLLNWSPYWGCSFSKVKSEVGASAIAASRRRSLATDGLALASVGVNVPSGLPSTLFAIRGNGEPPQIRLRAPGGRVFLATEGFAEGPDWVALRIPQDDTTYVAVIDPPGGTWRVSELAGSAPIASIGTAAGLPRRVVKGGVSGSGPTRVLRYEIAKAPGLRVRFIERGGDPSSEAPGAYVQQAIGVRGPGSGKIRFRPAEGKVRQRRIEAVVLVDGSPIETERVAGFRAPRFRRPAAPAVEARKRGGALVASWSRLPRVRSYRVLVDLSDGPTQSFDLRGAKLRLPGVMRPATSASVGVRGISPAGYLGKQGSDRVRGFPELVLARRANVAEILEARGWKARCTPVAPGDCEIEVVKGGRRLARGEVALDPGGSRTFLVRLTNVGRKVLRGAGPKLRLTARVALPGRPPESWRLILVR